MTWPTVPLNDLQSEEPRAITDGPFGSNLARRHYTESGPRVVRLQNIGDGRFIDEKAHISKEHFESLRAHEVKAGDLLVASLGEVLPRACLAPVSLGPAIVKADCIRVRLRQDVDSRWVLYAMQRPEVRRWADDHRHGVGRPRLGLKVIRQIPVPLPPLDEQRRIVDLLEDHLSRLDAADRELARAIDKLQALWRSALMAVRNSFTSDSRAIGEIASTSLGKMLDAKRQSGEPTPYLRNINVRWGSFDLADLQTTPLAPEEITKFDVREGDIMVCEGGEPGRCAVWRGDGSGIAFQKALHRIRVEQRAVVLPDFLALMLEECIRSGRADRLFTGTTIKHLPQEKLRTIEIAVPSLEEQQAALEHLAEVAEAREQLQSSLIGTLRKSQALRRSLLAAAFSGRLTGAESDLSEAEEMIGA